MVVYPGCITASQDHMVVYPGLIASQDHMVVYPG